MGKRDSSNWTDINIALRKIVCLLRPDKEIIQNSNRMVIRTLTTFRNYVMDFPLDEEFEEDLSAVDGRKCRQTTVRWEGDYLVCIQNGEKANRGWKHWLEGDLLHLEMTVEGVTCKQIFKKVK
ncbi:retinol-binding protein 5 isoform X3 [Polypterus senegalus]|uniref:retinol-binding protein 5 isoform X3 n=1 Tax=Polypterus senegalus TaxID=55291 RepID=UPI001965756F|nr:retinol-binding protein 5 isoform X3 [Polypterus senegalus]